MAARKKTAKALAPARLILDSGAVIALARGDQRARAFLASALESGTEVLVPSVVVAETIRGDGPKDAPVNRILAAIDAVSDADEVTGRLAGHLLGRSGSPETIDALVAASAIQGGGGRILAGDEKDLKRLARGNASITVHRL